ncbi:hypothetical protein M758_UG150000 [Ceratodon purpureus]|nr:hypothetical protein M758_UG150000 [Ceratodon purpureus]
MDPLLEPANAIAFNMLRLLLLLNNTENRVHSLWMEAEEEDEDQLRQLADNVNAGFNDAHNELHSTLHHFRLYVAFNFLDEDLGFWVKPRSTTWFSCFLLDQYDD